MRPFGVVCATTRNKRDFWSGSPLGRSCALLRKAVDCFDVDVAYENRDGLPAVYNRAIERHRSAGRHYLVMVHDDVFLNDVFTFQKLLAGFASYDIQGVAGTRCLSLEMARIGWYGDCCEDHAGGCVHPVKDRDGSQLEFVRFGPAPQPCVAVDGVFLAVNLERLGAVRFDERFAFDFYDLDFCLAAHLRGLRLGAAPVLLTHLSLGAGILTDAYRRSETLFREKYREASRRASFLARLKRGLLRVVGISAGDPPRHEFAVRPRAGGGARRR